MSGIDNADTTIAVAQPADMQRGRWLTLVPVEVFGAICEDHEDLPKAVGWGLSDAVEAWSDCNRAEGHIYRVEDLLNARRQPGETARVWAAEGDLPFFQKRWGEPNTGVDEATRTVAMDPPTLPSPIAKALAAARSEAWDKAVAALRDGERFGLWIAGQSFDEDLANDEPSRQQMADMLAAVKAEVLGGETTADWKPGDPVYAREPERDRCVDCGCEVFPPAGPSVCPECGGRMEGVTS